MTITEIEMTFGAYTNVVMREHVRAELDRYPAEAREALIGVLVTQYEGGRFNRPPEAATVVRMARDAGIRRRPRRGEVRPTDPDELEDYYHGPRGVLERVADRIAGRDEPDNPTVVRLRAEATGEVDPYQPPAPAAPTEPPQRGKAALQQRLRTMYDRHPDPAARDRRLRACGVAEDLASAKRLTAAPDEPPRPEDMSPEAWEGLSPAGRRAEHQFRLQEIAK